jgi:TPR repeat protein
MYANGEGVAKDEGKAVEWFKKAADQGNVDAQNNLGVMYYTGEGVPKDIAKAREWFRKAAAQGNADAKANLEGMK